MHQLSNDYQACKLIRLEVDDPKSPFAVIQDAYDPEDPQMRPSFFFLQRDGTWIDELGRSTQPEEEKFKCVFDSVGQVMQLLAALPAVPQIQRIPVSREQVEAHILDLKSGTLEQRVHQMLRRYHAAQHGG